MVSRIFGLFFLASFVVVVDAAFDDATSGSEAGGLSSVPAVGTAGTAGTSGTVGLSQVGYGVVEGKIEGDGSDVALATALRVLLPDGWEHTLIPGSLGQDRISWASGETWVSVFDRIATERNWSVRLDWNRKRLTILSRGGQLRDTGGAGLATRSGVLPGVAVPGAPVPEEPVELKPPSPIDKTLRDFSNEVVRFELWGATFEDIMQRLLPAHWQYRVPDNLRGEIDGNRYHFVTGTIRARALQDFLKQNNLTYRVYVGQHLVIVDRRF